LENAGSLFEGKRGPKPINAESNPDRLYAKIRQLNMELDWLKKSLGSAFKRTPEPDASVPLSTQCKLLKGSAEQIAFRPICPTS